MRGHLVKQLPAESHLDRTGSLEASSPTLAEELQHRIRLLRALAHRVCSGTSRLQNLSRQGSAWLSSVRAFSLASTKELSSLCLKFAALVLSASGVTDRTRSCVWYRKV